MCPRVALAPGPFKKNFTAIALKLQQNITLTLKHKLVRFILDVVRMKRKEEPAAEDPENPEPRVEHFKAVDALVVDPHMIGPKVIEMGVENSSYHLN